MASVVGLVLRACPVVQAWRVLGAPLVPTASLAPWARLARWVHTATAVLRAHPAFLARTGSLDRLDRMATTVRPERWDPVALLDSLAPVDLAGTRVPVVCVARSVRAGRRVLAARKVVLDSRGQLVPPDHAALAVRLAATVRRASGAPVAPTGPRVALVPPVPLALKVLQASRAHPARVARLVPPVVDRPVPLARRELLVCLVKWVGRVPQAPWEALVSRVPAASRAPRVCVAPQAKPSVVPWAPVARAVAPVRKVLRAPLALWASRALWVVLVMRVPPVYPGAWVAMGRWVSLVVRVSLVLSVCVEALVARVCPVRVALRALSVRAA